MVIGATLVILPDEAISAQDGDYIFSVDLDRATVTGYTGEGGDITIPSTLGGYTTMYLGSYCFLENRNVTSVIIPDSVRAIENSAFYYCTSLKTIHLSEGIEGIESYAFMGCSSLTYVRIPASTTSMGSGIFSSCHSLDAIDVQVANPNFASHNGILYNKAMTVLRECPGNKTGEVVVPNSVQSILGRSFMECRHNTSVTIQSRVTFIQGQPFKDCPSLTQINVADANPNYRSENGVLYDKAMTTLIQCPGGKQGSFSVHSGTEKVGDEAFSYCRKLTSVDLPDSVISVDDWAFSYCDALTEIDLGEGLESIGNYSFFQCPALTSLVFPATLSIIWCDSFIGLHSLTEFQVDADNSYFSSLGDALYSKGQETLIRYPDAMVGPFSAPSFVEKIDCKAFYGCHGITALYVPDDSVEVIYSEAFFNCSNLVSVEIGDGMNSLKDRCFQGCQSLSSVTIGEGPVSIGNYAFTQCLALTGIKMPGSLDSIGGACFLGCRALTHLVIPENVMAIGDNAFQYCENLTSIAFLGMTAPIDIGDDWIANTADELVGHAYSDSDFPAPGDDFHGLMMAAILTTVPGAPQDMTMLKGDGFASISWAAPGHEGLSDIVLYKVYKAESVNGDYVLLAEVTETAYNDTDVKEGDTYWYQVTAVNAQGESAPSQAISAEFDDKDETPVAIIIAVAILTTVGAIVAIFVLRRRRQ